MYSFVNFHDLSFLNAFVSHKLTESIFLCDFIRGADIREFKKRRKEKKISGTKCVEKPETSLFQDEEFISSYKCRASYKPFLDRSNIPPPFPLPLLRSFSFTAPHIASIYLGMKRSIRLNTEYTSVERVLPRSISKDAV